MKIICTQENLSHGLQLVSHIASKNISLPILSNVLIKAEGGIITLMTTNLEIGITCQIRGKIEKEGSFTVQAKTLNDYINLLTKEKVIITLDGDNLKIESGRSKTIMKGVSPSEFPLIPEVEAANEININSTTLREGLLSVASAAAVDETRPEINGVYFEIEDDKLTLAATDSYRLAEKKLILTKKKLNKTAVILPHKTINELVRILSGEEAGEVVMKYNENQALFLLKEVKITSRLIEGQYPDYRQIIPNEHQTQAILKVEEFINTIKKASLFCKAGGNDILLKLKKETNEVEVSAANIQIGESEAKQEAAIMGQDNKIVFNYRFILDGLQHISDEDCVFEMNTSTNPGLLRGKEDNSYLYIIMPIKQ